MLSDICAYIIKSEKSEMKFKFQNMIFYVFVLILATASANIVPYEDCGVDADVKQVDVEGCADVPCYFTLGTTHNLTFRFVPKIRAVTLRSNLIFTVLAVDHNALATPVNGCEGLVKSACPVEAYTTVDYKAEVYVSETFPPSRGSMAFRLYDEFDREFVCFKLSIWLQENPNASPNPDHLRSYTKI